VRREKSGGERRSFFLVVLAVVLGLTDGSEGRGRRGGRGEVVGACSGGCQAGGDEGGRQVHGSELKGRCDVEKGEEKMANGG